MVDTGDRTVRVAGPFTPDPTAVEVMNMAESDVVPLSGGGLIVPPVSGSTPVHVVPFWRP